MATDATWSSLTPGDIPTEFPATVVRRFVQLLNDEQYPKPWRPYLALIYLTGYVEGYREGRQIALREYLELKYGVLTEDQLARIERLSPADIDRAPKGFSTADTVNAVLSLLESK